MAYLVDAPTNPMQPPTRKTVLDRPAPQPDGRQLRVGDQPPLQHDERGDGRISPAIDAYGATEAVHGDTAGRLDVQVMGSRPRLARRDLAGRDAWPYVVSRPTPGGFA